MTRKTKTRGAASHARRRGGALKRLENWMAQHPKEVNSSHLAMQHSLRRKLGLESSPMHQVNNTDLSW